jgi:ABC-type antimicrobial peptide transport system permease subunit
VIIWQRFGFVAFVLPLSVFLGADVLARYILVESYTPTIRMTVIVSITILSAIIVYWIGIKLNKNA